MALLDDLIAHLEAEGVVGGSTGWTAYASYLPDTPNRVIAVFETGGGEPDQTDGTPYDLPTFQVRGRAGPHEYALLRDKMQDVFEALNNATPAGFVYIFATTSGPLDLGRDTNERPHLSWNFRCMRQRG